MVLLSKVNFSTSTVRERSTHGCSLDSPRVWSPWETYILVEHIFTQISLYIYSQFYFKKKLSVPGGESWSKPGPASMPHSAK